MIGKQVGAEKMCIRDSTYAELCKLDCSYPDKFAGKFGRLQIPTLREYLEWKMCIRDSRTGVRRVQDGDPGRAGREYQRYRV